ncbi:Ger(x)C family spore germination protein [Tissierella praeacuta]|uniref:Ger(x)C family spore germination protein n=1 Tax=Tissierella praeacuta TaxID=43131 RepID=UPI003342BFF3
MKKTKKNLIIVIYLVITSIALVSGSETRELQTLAIVTATGIDLEGDKVIITCEIVDPTFGGSQPSSNLAPTEENVIFVQGVGETVFEAIRNVTLHFDRKLFFSHASVLIFGEEFAKKGLNECLDFFLRDYEPRESAYMVVAKGAKAYDVIGVRGELSESSGEYLKDIFDKFEYSGKCFSVTMAEYFRYYYEVSNEPVIGVIQKVDQMVIDEKKRRQMTTKSIVDASGGAVLKRDYLVGYFDGNEILGYNFIIDRIGEGVIVFNINDELNKGKPIIGSERKPNTMEILNSKTKNSVEINDGQIHLNINIKLRVGLGEENKAVDVTDSEVLKALEKSCSERVESLVSATMDKGQKEFKQDNFNIGAVVHRQYPEVWKKISKDWHNIFPEISYSVNVETDIVKVGIVNVPSNLRKRR